MDDKHRADWELLASAAARVLSDFAKSDAGPLDWQTEDYRHLKDQLALVRPLASDPQVRSDIGHAISRFNERFPALKRSDIEHAVSAFNAKFPAIRAKRGG